MRQRIKMFYKLERSDYFGKVIPEELDGQSKTDWNSIGKEDQEDHGEMRWAIRREKEYRR